MKLQNLCLLLIFCVGVQSLRAQETNELERNQLLQAAFGNFPLLTPATNSAGRPEFQKFSLRKPVDVGGSNYYGFRFTVPARTNAADFVFAAFLPFSFYVEWDILPEHGEMTSFASNYLRVKRSDYWPHSKFLPKERDWFMMQSYPGKDLQDNQTYLIWFAYVDPPQDISLAFTFANLGANGNNKRRPMEKALGLYGPMSKPVVSPINHHTYVLLRPDTWKSSEKQAVAMGGHLATIRNQAEEDWLVKTFGKLGGAQRLLWIGLSDRDKKFHFTWSSGESASYTCWAKGEPNNAGRGEDFVAVYYPGHKEHGKWNDWNDRTHDSIGLPIQGVVEIIPKETPSAGTNTTEAKYTTTAQPGNVADNLPAVQILPQVVITSEGGSIKLQWPVANDHYMLEVTTNLNEPFTMFGYTEFTNTDAGMLYAVITNPAPQMFFRLRKP